MQPNVIIHVLFFKEIINELTIRGGIQTWALILLALQDQRKSE
jgi:hypothetical protein